MKQIFTFFCLLIVFNLNAQNIKGVITDKNLQPLEGVYIFNTNSSSHAHTIANGSFVIENNKTGDSLTIGLLGYEKTFLVLNESHFDKGITVALKGKTILLD